MATAELSREKKIAGDNGAIQQIISLIPGGVTLDFSEFEGDLVRAGHVIYRDGDVYKPLPTMPETYNELILEGNKEHVGVLIRDVSKSDPRASVLTAGQVNHGALPFPTTDYIREGLPRIEFLYVKDKYAGYTEHA